MNHQVNPPVLIIAYRRKKSLLQILELCKDSGVKKIYIAIDGPKPNSKVGINDNIEMNLVVSNFKNNFLGKIYLMNRNINIGCAPSVLSACDWIFNNEDSAIILEDDCIPTADFFEFSRSSIEVISNNDDVWLSCGTQFAPPSSKTDNWFLCSYPLTWGWATTKGKWLEISNALKKHNNLTSRDLELKEKVYWNAGARRANSGWVDVWDTILAQQILLMKKLVILPKHSLVTNIGNDLVATNTIGESNWIGVQTGIFSTPANKPIFERSVDLWLRNEFFKIRYRHLLTTKLTKLKDLLLAYKKPFTSLNRRWELANNGMKTL